jgi:hypothetical protein
MSRQTGLAVVVAFVLGTVACQFMSHPSFAQGTQVPGQPASGMGRYSTAIGGHTPVVVVTDTVTGESWTRFAGGGIGGSGWLPLGKPTGK